MIILIHMNIDFVGIGSLSIDLIKIKNKIYKRYGGPAINTAAFLQNFGLKTGVIGRVGSDQDGLKILQKLNNFGIDTSRVFIDQNLPTTVGQIVVENNEREILDIKNLKRLDNFREEDKDYLKCSKSILICLLYTSPSPRD